MSNVPYIFAKIIETTLNFKNMQYQIKRECWNPKTFNGYIDNPYWRIDFNHFSFGLRDSGDLWAIGVTGRIAENQCKVHKMDIEKIIKECKLSIVLKLKTESIK